MIKSPIYLGDFCLSGDTLCRTIVQLIDFKLAGGGITVKYGS